MEGLSGSGGFTDSLDSIFEGGYVSNHFLHLFPNKTGIWAKSLKLHALAWRHKQRCKNKKQLETADSLGEMLARKKWMKSSGEMKNNIARKLWKEFKASYKWIIASPQFMDSGTTEHIIFCWRKMLSWSFFRSGINGFFSNLHSSKTQPR